MIRRAGASSRLILAEPGWHRVACGLILYPEGSVGHNGSSLNDNMSPPGPQGLSGARCKAGQRRLPRTDAGSC